MSDQNMTNSIIGQRAVRNIVEQITLPTSRYHWTLKSVRFPTLNTKDKGPLPPSISVKLAELRSRRIAVLTN
jgi:hypothetical protein